MEETNNIYEPYTKKATNEIYKIAAAYRPTLPKTSTTDQCWEAVAEENDLEMGIERSRGKSDITIYKNDEKIFGMSMNDSYSWDEKQRDWIWDKIFIDIIRELKEKKLIKTPRRNKKTGEIILSKKELKRLATPTYTPEQKDELKRITKTLKNKRKTMADPEGIKRIEERIAELEKIGLENTKRGMR